MTIVAHMCYGLNCVPHPNSLVGALTPIPKNVASFGNSAIANVIG